MLFLAILVLLSALIIAGCAAYFSIIGMTLLFIGSGISIVVMGGALELGKLVAVSFLKLEWERLGFLLKSYLIAACFVLSVITSVGIYGFLAAGYNTTSVKVKGYEQVIENNNKAILQTKAEIERLSIIPDSTSEITATNTSKDVFVKQQLDLIAQKEKRINELQSQFDVERRKNADELTTAKGNLEQETQKEVDQIKLFNDRLAILDKEVQTWMDQGAGGLFKQNGLDKARETRNLQEKERAQIDNQIKSKQTSIDNLRADYNSKVKDISKSLADRIKTIEDKITSVELEITRDKQSINEYQNKVAADISSKLSTVEDKIKESKKTIKEKEAEIQKLQLVNNDIQAKILDTDVGTFKFVAKSIGITLDQTVNWFIWAIMFAFDPMAVTLIICFNHLIKNRKKKPAEIKVVEKIVEVIKTVPETTTTLAPKIETPSTEPPKPVESVYGTFDEDGAFNVGPGHTKVPGH